MDSFGYSTSTMVTMQRVSDGLSVRRPPPARTAPANVHKHFAGGKPDRLA